MSGAAGKTAGNLKISAFNKYRFAADGGDLLYIAELRGKALPEMIMAEDILTSNVFSFFKYMPRHIFLKKFLLELGIEVDDHELDHAEFRFWPCYQDNTEPNVVLLVGNYYILIEAKYTANFGKKTDKVDSQLIRESREGMQEAAELGLEFVLLGLTADYCYPHDKFVELVNINNPVIWMNWQRIYSLVYEILQENEDFSIGERLFAEDFCKLLETKRLRTYQGTMPLQHLGLLKGFEGDLFFPTKARHYSGVFIGFEKALSNHMGLSFNDREIFLKNQPYGDYLMNSRRV